MPHSYNFGKSAILLLIVCLLVTGCTSRTDVQPVSATPLPTTYAVKGFTPAPTPQVLVPDGGSEVGDGTKACSQLNGTIAVPGQVCPGTWLTVSDSFSCCSKIPVIEKTAKPQLTVAPLNLQITHDDAFVEI
jgi:hypothetical protein